jgi:hypothetical protein
VTPKTQETLKIQSSMSDVFSMRKRLVEIFQNR